MRTTRFLANVIAAAAVILMAAPAIAQDAAGSMNGLPTAQARGAQQINNANAMDLGDRRTPGRRQIPSGKVRSDSLEALVANAVN